MLETNLTAGKKGRRAKGHLLLTKPLTLPDSTTLDFAPWINYTGDDAPILASRASNAMQLSKAGIAPASLVPTGDFILQATVTLTTQSVQMLFGNLANYNGTGTFWITLNNTYQASTLLSIDGYNTDGAVQRFRFGTGKLAINTPHVIRLERKDNVISATIDGVAYPGQSMTKGFRLPPPYALYLGNSVDAAYPLQGTVSTFDYITYT